MSDPRKLKAEETPKPGDVFLMFDGPFGTAIVTKVYPDGSVDAERPMMQITGIVPGSVIAVERISSISREKIRQYTFYTFRDEIENRWYDELTRQAQRQRPPPFCPDCGSKFDGRACDCDK
jgi:hypothetical protein